MRFLCPKCRQRLREVNNSAVCENGHSYDKSRYGYYNLLLGGGAHGDNREMVECRRRFLAFGHYKPLADAVCRLVLEYTGRSAAVLDTGCGEGYYTDFIERALRERDGDSDVTAFDISKDAVAFTARKNKNIKTAVFGSYHMPLPDGEFDVALNMFSPNADGEIRRVLAVGGIYVMVIPAREHLFSLKAAVYDTPYKNEVQDTALPGFSLLLGRSISYKMELNSPEEISSLFGMTPYAYRTGSEGRARVEALRTLSVEADFLALVYKKEREI